MSDPYSAVVDGVGTQLLTALPIIATGAIGVATLLWGFPKALGFFRKLAK